MGKPDWDGMTHTVSGQVNLGAKSRNPLKSNFSTAEKRKKGEGAGCPDHSKVVIPQPGVQISLNGVVTVDEECLTDLGSLKYPGGSFSKVIFLKGDLHAHRNCVNYEQVRNIT